MNDLTSLERKYKRGSLTDSPFNLKGRDWLKTTEKQKRQLCERAFRYWRTRGFPHYQLSDADLASEFRQLLDLDWHQVFARHQLRGSNVGLRLANSFHRSMWSVRVSRYLSPMDVFKNDSLLRAAIRRSFCIWPDRFAANASCLRRILKTFPGTASVSNYRPTIAKALVAKYSLRGDSVLDFSAGYGGRLLGCLTLPRFYLGIEPCSNQVRGLRRMINTIGKLNLSHSDAAIYQSCAEDLMPSLPAESIGLVFSSPPYFNWERYSRESTQSFVRYRTYPEWVTEFLVPVLAESKRVLKRNGYLILNISSGKRLPSAGDVLRIVERLKLTVVGKYLMVFPKVPYLHPRNRVAEKCEHLLVFRRN
jgi:hypothetical protein